MTPLFRPVLVLFCLGGFVLPAMAYPPDSIVQQATTRFMRSTRHVGLSIGLYDRGKVYSWHYGSTEKGRSTPPTDETLYEIASITKTFTGILLGQAISDRKLNLQSPVTRYLSGRYPNLIVKDRPMRVIDLANHTSGLPKNLPDFPPGTAADDIIALNNNTTPATFLSELQRVRLASEPGTRYVYSNAGAQLTGLLLEKVYRRGYAELLHQYITGPAHMDQTWLNVPAQFRDRMARGYNGQGEPAPEMEQMRVLPAAAYLKSDIRDMLKYIAFNCDENGNKAVRLAHIPTYMNAAEDGADLALFWQTKYYPGQPLIIQHGGGSFGMTSYCLMVPGRQLGIVCLANDASADTEAELRNLSEQVLSQCIRE